MAGEDDVELRDLVAHTLETRGVLGNIRAQLRASVFLALEEQESQQTPHPLVSSRFQEYLKTKNGQVATALVREFLTFFELDYTCSVFDPETNALEVCPMRNELASNLSLDAALSTGPLLDSLLQRTTSSSVDPSKQPLSITSTPRQDQENSNALIKGTFSSQTQPVTTDSLLTTLNTTTSTTATSDLFTIPTSVTGVSGSSGMDLSPFDQFAQTPKPGSLPPLAENSLPILDVDARPVSNSFKPVEAAEHRDNILGSFGTTEFVVGSEGGQEVGNASAPLHLKEDQVNGKSTDVDELDDFFGTKLETLEPREGKGGKDKRGKDSNHDDFHSDESFSENLNAKFVGRSSNKFEETEDMTLSQNSITADYDFAEPART